MLRLRPTRDDLRLLPAGALLVALIAVADAALGPDVVLVGFLVVPVFLMSAVASVTATSLVAALTVLVAGLVGPALSTEPSLHPGRTTGVALSGLLAVGIARVRTRREAQARDHERQLAAAQVSADLGHRLRVALAASRMGTWVWHADTGQVVWDHQLEALFGLGPGDFDGTFESWMSMLHPDDREDVLAEVQAAVGEGRDYVVVHRCVWSDGTVRWIEGRGEVLRDARGNVAGTTGVSVDVTDRKNAEAETDGNRRLTVQVLELADLFDPDRRPEQVRRLACRHALRLFGCSTALVWAIEDHHLVLTAAAPDQPDWSRITVPLSHVVRAPSHLGLLRPTWLPADQREALPAETRGTLDRLGLGSSLWVPMTTGGRAEALLCFGWRTPQARPGAERVQVLERFAGQVALAVSQSQRGAARDEAHQLTARLLSGLVPRTHWTYRGFDSAGLYQPGEDRLLLGGDFYDMLPRGEHSVTFVLGDVSGHGPEAAALGATLRAAWSGLARIDADPQTMLTALHQVVQARRPSEETFATAVVGTIEAHSREARFALAGHPSPLVLDYAARTVPAITGPPLGVLDEPESWPVRHLVLPDPGALLLFTDGLIEGRAAPGSAERFGTERLLARLNRLSRPWAASQADLSALVADVTAANGGPLADDVAVLLVSPRPAAEAACSPVTAEDDASA